MEGLLSVLSDEPGPHLSEGERSRGVRGASLQGRPPSPATKAYYRYANHPIRLYSPLAFQLRRLCLGLAAAIGRFYRQT